MTAGIVLGLVALYGAWLLRERRYRGAFQLPARRDDLFVCRADGDAGQASSPITLGPDGFDAPAGLVRRGQTVFLRLSVEASPVGRLFDPFIEVSGAGGRFRQVFERGAVGSRYLNLSPLFQVGDGAPVGRVALAGRGLRWKADASLALHEPPSFGGQDVLVLAPHPDDAEIAAFGLYAGRRSWVVTVTAGESGRRDLSAVVPPGPESVAWSARLRVWDSLTIPELGDVPAERCLNLVYPDGQLRAMYEGSGRPFRLGCEAQLPRRLLRARNRMPTFQGGDPDCTWDGLVGELRRLLDETRPAVVVCPHPLIDVHPDHLFTTVALERALRVGGPAAPAVLLYVVDVRDARLYPFGPADSVVSLPPIANGDWLADAIYSHPLSPDARRGKYFAVEAAHDLRTYSTGGPRTVAELLKAARRGGSAFVADMGQDPFAYQRRAPRPNELYYLVSPSSLAVLVDRALAGLGGRAGAA